MALTAAAFKSIRKKSKFIRASARRNVLGGFFLLFGAVFKDDRISQD